MVSKVVDWVSGVLAAGGDQLGGAAGFLKPIDTARIARESKLEQMGCESGRRELHENPCLHRHASSCLSYGHHGVG